MRFSSDCEVELYPGLLLDVYYYCIKKYDQAQRYFGLQVLMDRFHQLGLVLGMLMLQKRKVIKQCLHFAQALVCFQGILSLLLVVHLPHKNLKTRFHLPMLYVGMEYMRTHNFKLAEQYSLQAKAICPLDPFVLNELGVVAYHMKEYPKAVQWFKKTLAHSASSLNEIWEPTLVNQAHAQRKLKMYHKAVSYYEKALTLSTHCLSTFAGWHMLIICRQVLWLKPDDQFCTEMLSLALEDDCRGNAHR
ncbi:hypothetical protein J5N97_021255 [Dioscorea zingiberensis]|uniref:Uncharacterized protein n=1 Tax=Dioscorea zingiberensis TaxID=325984 RepID=A0A9D5CHA2_9LILI|nr:hypothetical protein J5N97_021255 [Dioscorea zingiberensis]